MTEHGGAAALKQNNLAALRSALYHTDFATKKELAEQCRLSLAACTALLGEMIDDGQVLELAFAASNGGRPARRFSINPNYAHILCLYTANNDVERSGIALRVCDLKGNSLQEKFCPLNDILPEDLTLFITQMVQADPLIRAVGIGISGVTDREGAIESLAFPALNGFNPKKVLEEQLGITVITENDMHFTSYGFYVRNPCDHPYSLSVLYWPSHRSAGAGTVVDGHIIVGSTKYAGELISLPLINSTATKGRDRLAHDSRREYRAADADRRRVHHRAFEPGHPLPHRLCHLERARKRHHRLLQAEHPGKPHARFPYAGGHPRGIHDRYLLSDASGFEIQTLSLFLKCTDNAL